jgi:hypothetical protein
MPSTIGNRKLCRNTSWRFKILTADPGDLSARELAESYCEPGGSRWALLGSGVGNDGPAGTSRAALPDAVRPAGLRTGILIILLFCAGLKHAIFRLNEILTGSMKASGTSFTSSIFLTL